ncbi:AmmeMemoRadiSam system protein B [Agarivorans sp. QJM3NY_29]|uniref:AmmeMemoRadiSam system protein B n=1 Tax=unclassified Agarivorans TaxID=2636026 RepID=UPI003D7D757A
MKSRPAAVAGQFYPAGAEHIKQQLSPWLLATHSESARPKALLVPHAGYQYSGQIAAAAYRYLVNHQPAFRRVLIAGPNHRVPLAGVAISSAEQFETPLGSLPVEQHCLSALTQFDFVHCSDEAHRLEHAIEVQLPFLQLCLAQFAIVPLVVGDVAPAQLAALFEVFCSDPQTLLVISSDLSHFLSYRDARLSDEATLKNIISGQGGLQGEQACGYQVINGFLAAARQHQLQAKLVAKGNSGDVTKDHQRVVGYASIAFFEH